QFIDGLGKLVLERGHLVEHGAGGVAEEDDLAGVSAVAEDRALRADRATAGRAEHRERSATVTRAAAGARSRSRAAAAALTQAAGADADQAGGFGITFAAAFSCDCGVRGTGLVGPAFRSAGVGGGVLHRLAERISAETLIRNAAGGRVLGHRRFGDDRLI